MPEGYASADLAGASQRVNQAMAPTTAAPVTSKNTNDDVPEPSTRWRLGRLLSHSTNASAQIAKMPLVASQFWAAPLRHRCDLDGAEELGFIKELVERDAYLLRPTGRRAYGKEGQI